MGLNASKRVVHALDSSPDFDSACEAVYDHCLAEAQHAFPGVRLYQLADAAARLHAALSASIPLVRRWVPSPPTQGQVDAALRRVAGAGADALAPAEFRAFALELFTDAVVSSARGAVARGVPVGFAGIAVIGVVSQAGLDVVGRAMGVYAIGFAAFIYLALA